MRKRKIYDKIIKNHLSFFYRIVVRIMHLLSLKSFPNHVIYDSNHSCIKWNIFHRKKVFLINRNRKGKHNTAQWKSIKTIYKNGQINARYLYVCFVDRQTKQKTKSKDKSARHLKL